MHSRRRLRPIDKWERLYVYCVRTMDKFARARRVELQTIDIERVLTRRAASKMKNPTLRLRVDRRGPSNATVERTVGRNGHQCRTTGARAKSPVALETTSAVGFSMIREVSARNRREGRHDPSAGCDQIDMRNATMIAAALVTAEGCGFVR